MHLACLKCTSILDKARIEDVEVDICPACGGLWLDHGEIERLSRKMVSELDRLRRLLQPNGPPPGPPAIPSEIQSSCPACTGDMKEVTLGTIRIDFCLRCKGFYLDRGEIDGAIAAVKGQRMTVAQIVAAAASEVPT
jgi:Zn-finger nucleic acid-binding protein